MGAYGQGSISERKRRVNGREKTVYLARYWGPDGKQHSRTFERKTDARNFLSQSITDKRRNEWFDPALGATAFGKWATEWFEGQHGLGDPARARDDSLLRNHILPAFATRPLAKISPLEVRSWINRLVAKGLAPRTVHACFRIFGTIMRAAVAAKMIPDAPVGRGVVDLPKIERKSERFLTEAEVEKLVDLVPSHYQALIYTAAYTGCRWQELAGLRRENLDLLGRKLHVRTVVERVGGTVRIKEFPKSDMSRRTIGLPQRVVDLLAIHLRGAKESELAFTGPDGGILREANFRKRQWNPAITGLLETLPKNRAAELAGITFHDLRHTHVAWLIADGTAALSIQRRLGHRDIKTTMNTYGHLFPHLEEELVERLDDRFDQGRMGAPTADVVSIRR